MEKLKKLVSPGHRQDDDILYSIGQSDPAAQSRNTGGLSGEGSHFGSYNHPTTSSAGASKTPIADQFTGSTQSSTQPSGGVTGTDYSSGNQLSRPQPPLEKLSSASIKSGVLGHDTSSREADAPYSEAPLTGDTNKPLPNESGTTSSGLTGQSLPDRTATSTQRSGEEYPSSTDRSFPLAGGTSSGEPTSSSYGTQEPRSTSSGMGFAKEAGAAGMAGTAAGLGRKENAESAYDEPTSRKTSGVIRTNPSSSSYGDTSRTGYGDTSTAGGYDPSSTSRSTEDPSSQHQYGRDAVLTGGAGAAGLGAYEATKDRGTADPSVASSSTAPGYGDTSRTDYGDTSNTGNEDSSTGTGFARDAGVAGITGTATDLATKSSTSGAHSSGYEDPSSRGVSGETGTGTSGKDYSNTGYDKTLGRGDNSAITGSGTSGTGYDDSSSQGLAGAGTAAGLAGAAGTAAAWSGHEHGGKGHTYSGDPCDPEESSVGGPHFAQGSHITDTANRLDPNTGGSSSGVPVSSADQYLGTELHIPGDYPETPGDMDSSAPYGDLGTTAGGYTTGYHGSEQYKPAPTTAAGYETGSHDPSQQHHYGRDAALGAGALGAGGLAAAASTRGQSTAEDPTTKTTGPHSSNVANVTDPTNLPQPEKEEGSTTTGPHKFDLLNKLDPRVKSNPSKTSSTSASYSDQRYDPSSTSRSIEDPSGQHHYGRDAALAGGAGATGLGAYEATKSRGTTDPSTTSSSTAPEYGASTTQPTTTSSSTAPGYGSSVPQTTSTSSGQNSRHGEVSGSSPYSASAVDPRVDSTPRNDTRGTSTGQDQHHYGRDVALAGGAGATGLGAYETTKGSRTDSSKYQTQPGYGSAHNELVPPTTQSGYGSSATQPTTSSTEPGYGSPITQPTTKSSSTAPGSSSEQTSEEKHHYGRDAALAGGAGVAGVGAYEAMKGRGNDPSTTTSSTQPGHGSSTTQPTTSSTQPSYGSPANQPAGTTGTSPSGYERGHSRYDSAIDPQKQDESHIGRNAALSAGAVGAGGVGAYEYEKHEREKREKELLAQQEADRKKYEKEQAANQKSYEKDMAAQKKAHEKEQAKLEKEREKEAEKAAKKHEKEEEKKEKKHEKEEEKKEKKHSGLFGFLHRDKDKTGEELRTSTEQREDEHQYGRDAAIGGAGAAAAGTTAAVHGSDHEGRNRLHKEPPPEYGTAPNAIDAPVHKGTDGVIGRPDAISGLEQTKANEYGAVDPNEQKDIVIEPHTGLPMNIGKYGSGAGGTDGNKAIGGLSEQTHQDAEPVDWDKVKKANTPY